MGILKSYWKACKSVYCVYRVIKMTNAHPLFISLSTFGNLSYRPINTCAEWSIYMDIHGSIVCNNESLETSTCPQWRASYSTGQRQGAGTDCGAVTLLSRLSEKAPQVQTGTPLGYISGWKIFKWGVPFVPQQVKDHRVVSLRMWVWSLASLSGLRICCCCKLRHKS